jgi:hypothetical protein
MGFLDPAAVPAVLSGVVVEKVVGFITLAACSASSDGDCPPFPAPLLS